MAHIHEVLKILRQYHGYTQTELAKKIGIRQDNICIIELGRKTISLKILEKYSEVFMIPVSSIFFLHEQIQADNMSVQFDEYVRIHKKITVLPSKLREYILKNL